MFHQEYVDVEKAIYRLETHNVVKKYEAKTTFADDLKKTVDQLEATYKELKKQTFVPIQFAQIISICRKFLEQLLVHCIPFLLQINGFLIVRQKTRHSF
jgi:acetyl-CoA carboxylase alpha subunit